MKKLKTERGFTFIEILTVIGIISTMFLVFIPQVNSALLKSKESGIYTDFRVFQQANESYFRETRGANLQVSSLNRYLDEENEVRVNGAINQTKNKDPWKNPYEVTFETGKITFSSYGKNEDPTTKAYNLVTYLHNGIVSSCTTGLGTRNMQLSVPDLDADFQCGDKIETNALTPIGSLGTPENFVAKNITQTKAEISWDHVIGATSYILKKDGVTIYAGSNTSFPDITLTPNTTYTYSVAAKNESELSASAILTVKTEGILTPPLNAITNFNAKNITPSSISLSWDAVVGATSYELKRGATVIYTGANTTFNDISLLSNTTYSYTLVAKNLSSTSGPVTKSFKTAPMNNSTFSNFSFFEDSNIAQHTDGTLWVWGRNDSGELGLGHTTNRSRPTKFGTDTWLRYFNDPAGNFGVDINSNLKLLKLPNPPQIFKFSNIKDIAFDYSRMNVLLEDGTLWYFNDFGKMVEWKPGNKWTSIHNSTHFSIALNADGSIWALGEGMYGSLGIGVDYTKLNVPTRIGTSNNWADISVSTHTVLGIQKDGSLWGWGSNRYGQLGLGNTTNYQIPTRIGTDSNWKNIYQASNLEFESDATFGIKKDGTLWAWGRNYKGKLGTGNAESTLTPIQVGTNNDWMTLSASNTHVLALKNDGSLWSWGDNYYGQLGRPANYLQVHPTPIQVGTDNDWKTILSYGGISGALKHDQTLWLWGDNMYGRIGDGTDNDAGVPKKVTIN